MGHNLCLHFGAHEHPCTTYFDVHQGCRVLTHSHVGEVRLAACPLVKSARSNIFLGLKMLEGQCWTCLLLAESQERFLVEVEPAFMIKQPQSSLHMSPNESFARPPNQNVYNCGRGGVNTCAWSLGPHGHELFAEHNARTGPHVWRWMLA